MSYKDPEKHRAYQRIWARNKREKQAAEALQLEKEKAEFARLHPFAGDGENGNRYDKEGRRLGQLDALYHEKRVIEKEARALMHSLTSLLDAKEITLSEEIDPKDVEGVIKRRVRLNAIDDEIAETTARKKKVGEQLALKNRDVERYEAEVTVLRNRIAEYSEGGMLYKQEMMKAEYVLNEAEGNRSAAEATLKSGRYGDLGKQHWDSTLSSAQRSIERAKSTPERLGELRQRAEDTLKVYTLGEAE